MKICVAQTRPIKGDLKQNIRNHKVLIELAVANGADTIIFPELSLTGYEPELANELATTPDDSRLIEFQKISDTRRVTIGVGVPLKDRRGICISLLLFKPHQGVQTYAKQHLHPDEEPFFVAGQHTAGFIGEEDKAALAICYEISIPGHADNASRNGAATYIASVAKSVDGISKALDRLAEIAKNNTMHVLMANSVGHSDNFECGGKTSVWNNKGILLGQLNETDEGVLIFDTASQELIQQTLPHFKHQS